jgi:hypothetical protein
MDEIAATLGYYLLTNYSLTFPKCPCTKKHVSFICWPNGWMKEVATPVYYFAYYSLTCPKCPCTKKVRQFDQLAKWMDEIAFVLS